MNRFEYTTSSPNTFHIPHHLYLDNLEKSMSYSLLDIHADDYYVHLGRMDPNRKIIELIRNFGGAIQDEQLLLVGEVPDKVYLNKIICEAKRFKNVSVKPQKINVHEFDSLILNSAGVIGPLNDYHNSGIIFHVLSHNKSVLTVKNRTSQEIQAEFRGWYLQLDEDPSDRSALLKFVSECKKQTSDSIITKFPLDRYPHVFFQKHIEVYKTTLRGFEAQASIENESEPNI